MTEEVGYDPDQPVEHDSLPDDETDSDSTAPVNYKAYGIPVDIDGNPVISIQYQRNHAELGLEIIDMITSLDENPSDAAISTHGSDNQDLFPWSSRSPRTYSSSAASVMTNFQNLAGPCASETNDAGLTLEEELSM